MNEPFVCMALHGCTTIRQFCMGTEHVCRDFAELLTAGGEYDSILVMPVAKYLPIRILYQFDIGGESNE